eukprot:TRINITY_DN4932_c0_g1_i1.p1 TRINITY_DN4932_c0_g1~~TRINITY_DN4932_c0_g1_i1.p1  ORF type:complete len:145 (+),score=23.22 TRINITY_DN4932_c0_g1_i1:59-436(+)
MTVVLPKGESKAGVDGIVDRFQKNDESVYVLHQKKPQWNEKLKAFTLNFHGRVTRASVKNFQLVYKGDYEDEEAYSSLESGKVSLQFGKREMINLLWMFVGHFQFTKRLQYACRVLIQKLACEKV